MTFSGDDVDDKSVNAILGSATVGAQNMKISWANTHAAPEAGTKKVGKELIEQCASESSKAAETL